MCILVVDDEPFVLGIVAQSLRDAGYEVITAKTGSAALDLIRGRPTYFTCLVIDYYMQQGTAGADVIEIMRTAYPTLPIVMTTVMSHARSTAWLNQYKVQLLVKPYSLSRLIGLVDQLLHTAPRK